MSTKYPIDLYKRETPRWILQDEDTLIWAGVGGSVELSIKELKLVLRRVDKIINSQKKNKDGYSFPFKDKSIGLHDGVHRPRYEKEGNRCKLIYLIMFRKQYLYLRHC